MDGVEEMDFAFAKARWLLGLKHVKGLPVKSTPRSHLPPAPIRVHSSL